MLNDLSHASKPEDLTGKFSKKNRQVFEEKRRSSNHRKQELKDKILQLQQQMQMNKQEQQNLQQHYQKSVERLKNTCLLNQSQKNIQINGTSAYDYDFYQIQKNTN